MTGAGGRDGGSARRIRRPTRERDSSEAGALCSGRGRFSFRVPHENYYRASATPALRDRRAVAPRGRGSKGRPAWMPLLVFVDSEAWLGPAGGARRFPGECHRELIFTGGTGRARSPWSSRGAGLAGRADGRGDGGPAAVRLARARDGQRGWSRAPAGPRWSAPKREPDGAPNPPKDRGAVLRPTSDDDADLVLEGGPDAVGGASTVGRPSNRRPAARGSDRGPLH